MRIKIREFFANVSELKLDQYDFFDTSHGLCLNFSKYVVRQVLDHEFEKSDRWLHFLFIANQQTKDLISKNTETWEHYSPKNGKVHPIKVVGYGTGRDCYLRVCDSVHRNMYDINSEDEFTREYSKLRLHFALHLSKVTPETITVLEDES